MIYLELVCKIVHLHQLKVKAHPYVSGSDQCKPLVIETIKFLYDLDISDDREVDTSNPLARPRIPHEILFAIGGWSGGSPTNVMETYDTRADRWIECQWGDPLGMCKISCL